MQKIQLLLLVAVLLLSGCSEKHFITDDAYRSQVEKDFQEKQRLLPDGDLFAVFNESLSLKEKEALIFLYAYMPIGDLTDYEGDLYLRSVRSTFKAQQEMPWGDSIPEDIFRHFVLPIRVNNETLDESRIVFYDELKDRVKNLSLHDAILEVNHWCHEKVVYTPSDARTSSPMASVKTAYGRCGEESTFTVAALRAVGIPARQVYTPRWAHTDDNHAWVEAWVDGKWYFMGACEPEPVLDLGWFNGPAYRGMLMHTKAFGRYNGPEEVMSVTANYTEINVIDNYAPTAKAYVTVVDASGSPVEGADVEFKIYNYAEFYSVATKKTDKEGKSFLSSGKGDLFVWASKDNKFGYGKVSMGKEESITIILDKTPGYQTTFEMDIVPPVDGAIPATVTEEQKETNAKRLLDEDKIRNTYVSTFYSIEKADSLAKALGVDPLKTADYLVGSRGNWKEIEQFLIETPLEKHELALELLGVISAKDLRDTPADVLKDHLNNTPADSSSLFAAYIMNPRVANEFLTPYKKVLAAGFESSFIQSVKENPQLLVKWVSDSIRLADELNAQRIPIMPLGVWKARVADTDSRNVFFVAMARSLGIPAQIEPVAGKVQYYHQNQWIDVDFTGNLQDNPKQGKVTASYKAIKSLQDPQYYSHFTIAKLGADAKLQTLNFERSGSADMGMGNSWSALLKTPLNLDEGNYMLVTGTRMANGSVLTNVTFFSVVAGKTTQIDLKMRENTEEVQVIGSINAEASYRPADSDKEQTILSTTGRGYFVVAILGARQEPTNHALRDLAQFAKEYEAWGRSMVLLFPNDQQLKNFDAKEFGTLPKTITFGVDTDAKISKMLVNAMNLPNADTLPIFVIADTFGRVVFVSQGYTIGLGEQMLKVIHKL